MYKKNYITKQIDVPKLNKNIMGLIPFIISFTKSILKSYLFLKKILKKKQSTLLFFIQLLFIAKKNKKKMNFFWSLKFTKIEHSKS